MKTKNKNEFLSELDKLSALVREMVNNGRYEDCMEPVCDAMKQNPDAPQPHNLLGIVLEKLGNHAAAMKHFRAAWALDPTYAPATYNLNAYGTFFSHGKCAFDESDLTQTPSDSIEIIYDERGIGHMVSKVKFKYDERGIGHVIGR